MQSESIASQSTSLNQQQIQALRFESPIKADWIFSTYQESVFNSSILVLEAGDKKAPPLLLVHGLGVLGMQDWFGVIPELTKHYHVIAIDLPGFAHSENPEGRYSPRNYAAVLAEVVDHYIAEPTSVVGHSMGGAVSLYFAGKYPEKLNKLVLVDAAGILHKVAFIKPISNVPKPDIRLPKFLSTKLAQLNDFTTGLIEEGAIYSYLSELLQRSDGAWKLVMGETPNMNAALSLVEEDFSEIVSNLKIETHIIWGEEDAIAPLRTAKVLNSQLINSDLATLPDVGHVPMKQQPKQFLALLDSALNGGVQKEVSAEVSARQIETFHCEDQHSREFSGHYRHMIIEDCNNVLLKNVVAESIRIKDSLVRLENVSLSGAKLALNIKRSVVELTNVTITAQQGVKLNESRFDGAGMQINASEHAINVVDDSNIIFSLSRIHSPIYQGLAHDAIEVEKGIIDDRFK
ncbi:alpha/beta hydrolase [uncultured Pseudoalteromonas sp.]|uniref:alpha/beta fold hydrolase n=1 Tax=unclassified Pseudoalteromonas TaxID=194690 RepID=UPI00140CE0C1|nr:alpha/beta hydrolase [uncultured Pseudoalteromonas sp.]MED5511263.1 alpha/beta hydrolase [Pseudomonadota bacterium]